MLVLSESEVRSLPRPPDFPENASAGLHAAVGNAAGAPAPNTPGRKRGQATPSSKQSGTAAEQTAQDRDVSIIKALSGAMGTKTSALEAAGQLLGAAPYTAGHHVLLLALNHCCHSGSVPLSQGWQGHIRADRVGLESAIHTA